MAKISFIGSVNAGRAVMNSASATLKALTLGLAAECVDRLRGRSAGRSRRRRGARDEFPLCHGAVVQSTSRVYLHADIHDATLPDVKRVREIKVGLPTERDTGWRVFPARRSSTRR